MKEWEWDGNNYARGSSDPRVSLIQEWLCLHEVNVVIDGDFGPATERAVRLFQNRQDLCLDGIVGRETFEALVLPMANSERALPRASTLSQMVANYAELHLGQHPREVGGENRGPWVRRYLEGLAEEGSPWCAGFVSSVLRQAAATMNTTLPFALSASCGVLAAGAQAAGRFVAGTGAVDDLPVRPGTLMLVKDGSTGWQHVGIVVRPDEEVLETIEGNTNDEGSSEGYEVCRRERNYANKDFINV